MNGTCPQRPLLKKFTSVGQIIAPFSSTQSLLSFSALLWPY